MGILERIAEIESEVCFALNRLYYPYWQYTDLFIFRFMFFFMSVSLFIQMKAKQKFICV